MAGSVCRGRGRRHTGGVGPALPLRAGSSIARGQVAKNGGSGGGNVLQPPPHTRTPTHAHKWLYVRLRWRPSEEGGRHGPAPPYARPSHACARAAPWVAGQVVFAPTAAPAPAPAAAPDLQDDGGQVHAGRPCRRRRRPRLLLLRPCPAAAAARGSWRRHGARAPRRVPCPQPSVLGHEARHAHAAALSNQAGAAQG